MQWKCDMINEKNRIEIYPLNAEDYVAVMALWQGWLMLATGR
jgi:hypothetical protein